MTITRETGLMNCILDGNTVILDFVNKHGTHKKHYHKYKSQEKAMYMWSLFKQNAVHSFILFNETQRKES